MHNNWGTLSPGGRQVLGESLRLIGKYLSHNKIETTSRRAYLTRERIKALSVRVEKSIGADILDSSREDAAATR